MHKNKATQTILFTSYSLSFMEYIIRCYILHTYSLIFKLINYEYEGSTKLT
mgnify:CR=1 FL=1